MEFRYAGESPASKAGSIIGMLAAYEISILLLDIGRPEVQRLLLQGLLLDACRRRRAPGSLHFRYALVEMIESVRVWDDKFFRYKL